jgi:hypothetical protein
VRRQWRTAALRGKGHSRHPKRGGCPSARRPFTAPARRCLPIPAHVPLLLLMLGLLAAAVRAQMPRADHMTHYKNSFLLCDSVSRGVSECSAPVHGACAPPPAHHLPRTPSPAYARTFGCGGTCVNAPWGPQEPLKKMFFEKKNDFGRGGQESCGKTPCFRTLNFDTGPTPCPSLPYIP